MINATVRKKKRKKTFSKSSWELANTNNQKKAPLNTPRTQNIQWKNYLSNDISNRYGQSLLDIHHGYITSNQPVVPSAQMWLISVIFLIQTTTRSEKHPVFKMFCRTFCFLSTLLGTVITSTLKKRWAELFELTFESTASTMEVIWLSYLLILLHYFTQNGEWNTVWLIVGNLTFFFKTI